MALTRKDRVFISRGPERPRLFPPIPDGFRCLGEWYRREASLEYRLDTYGVFHEDGREASSEEVAAAIRADPRGPLLDDIRLDVAEVVYV